jgi:hypothetical protein
MNKYLICCNKLNMYCGNNANNRSVIRGEKVIGTRFKCMKKGVGKGLHMSYDDSYLDDYQPIDDTKSYCGNKDDLPEGYDRFGNLHECFIKGIGVGKRQKALKINKKMREQTITRQELVILCKELGIRRYAGLSKELILQLVINHLANQ